MSDIPPGLTNEGIAAHLFWLYEKAKGRFRHFMGKPVRRLRRFMHRKGKGKGKGKGKSGYLLMSMTDEEVENTFFGKGGANVSAKANALAVKVPAERRTL